MKNQPMTYPLSRGILAIIILACGLHADRSSSQAISDESTLEEPANRPVSSGAFYSLTQHQPPLPFNPFPHLPVEQIQPGVFVFNDTKVDYRQFRALHAPEARETKRSTAKNFQEFQSMMVAESQRSSIISVEDSGGGVQAANAGASGEHVELQPGAGGTKNLIMSQLVVGTKYYVMAKQDITPDIDNPWYFLGGFVATSPNATAGIVTPPGVSAEFYSLWPGEYAGPRLTIDSPANGAVVSGDVTISMRVTDISPVSLYLYLNGQPLASVGDLLTIDMRTEFGAKHSGKAEMQIPAGLLRNGQNHVSIVARNHGVAVEPDPNGFALGNIAPFSTTEEITLVGANGIAIVSNPSMSSPGASQATHKVEVLGPGDVTLDVFDVGGTLIRSIATTVTEATGGNVTLLWDYTRSDGSAFLDNAYAARYTFTPTGQITAASGGGNTIWRTNVIDRSPLISGSPLLTWMEMDGALDALADDVFENLYNFFDWAIPNLFYTAAEIGQNRTNPLKWEFQEFSMTTDVAFFHQFMQNQNFDSWVYFGHGNQQALGFPTSGGGGGAAGTTVTANDVANDLGNLYVGHWVKYSRRLRAVIMQSCWSGNINGNPSDGSPPVITEWPLATGTPIGVDQTLNRIYKTAFVGFENTVSAMPTFVEALLYDWPHPNLQLPNAPLVESFSFALDFAWEGDTTFIQSQGPLLLGFPWLPYRNIYDSQLANNDFSSIQF